MAEEDKPEEAEATAEGAEAEESAESEEGSENGEKKGKKKKGAAPKKKSKLPLIVALLGVVLLAAGGYVGVVAYTEYEKRQMAKRWGTQHMTPEERAAYEEEQKLLETKKKEQAIQDFVEKKQVSRTYFDECQVMDKTYTPPKDWEYDKLPLQTVLGLPKYVGEDAVNERCAEFASTVDNMEQLSHRKNHTYLCIGAQYKLPGGFFFEPDPKGKGVYHGHEALTRDKKFIPLKPGKSTIFAQWQFHNAGDGCIVVGYKKMKGSQFIIRKEVLDGHPYGR